MYWEIIIKCKCYWLLFWGFSRREKSPTVCLCPRLCPVSWSPLYGYNTLGCLGYSGAHKRPSIGNHSALLTDGSIAPAPTITADWGHSFTCNCSLSAHIQNKYTHGSTQEHTLISMLAYKHTQPSTHTDFRWQEQKCCCKRIATKEQ